MYFYCIHQTTFTNQVDTKKAAVKIDKDKVIKELTEMIEELKKDIKLKGITSSDLIRCHFVSTL